MLQESPFSRRFQHQVYFQHTQISWMIDHQFLDVWQQATHHLAQHHQQQKEELIEHMIQARLF
jgi:hypothetical protein